jgi:hypothetical protein
MLSYVVSSRRPRRLASVARIVLPLERRPSSIQLRLVSAEYNRTTESHCAAAE